MSTAIERIVIYEENRLGIRSSPRMTLDQRLDKILELVEMKMFGSRDFFSESERETWKTMVLMRHAEARKPAPFTMNLRSSTASMSSK